jgi:iron(III) transport system permease protein
MPGSTPKSAALPSKLFYGLIVLVLLWVAILPVAILLAGSILGKNGGLTLDNYAAVLADASTYSLFGYTAVFAVGSTTLGLGLAIFFAWVIERTDLHGRQIFYALILLPMAIPSMVYAVSWTQLLAPNNGLINVAVRAAGFSTFTLDIYSLPGMIFVQGLSLASHAYLLIAAAFKLLEPSWEEQAAVCGSRLFGTLRRITLPVLRPALLAATLFFLVVAMETFDVPVTLGLTSHVNVVSTRIFWLMFPETGSAPDNGTASALSTLLLLVALGLIGVYQRSTRYSGQFATVTGRGYRPRRISLGRWRLPILILISVVAFFGMLLPLLMLIWRSLIPFYVTPSLKALPLVGFGGYRSVLHDPEVGRAISNTGLLSLVTGVATVALAMAICWNVRRAAVAPVWRRGLSMLSFVPQALPGVVIALALILTYLRLPVPIYGTLWIIALALLTKFIAFSSGAIQAAQMQVSRELEEASWISGAKAFRTYRLVVVPLIAPALVNCFLWVVIHVIRDLGMALMLYSGRSITVGTKLWSLWSFSRVGEVSAIGTLTVVTLGVLLALPWIFRNLPLGGVAALIRRGRVPGWLPRARET